MSDTLTPQSSTNSGGTEIIQIPVSTNPFSNGKDGLKPPSEPAGDGVMQGDQVASSLDVGLAGLIGSIRTLINDMQDGEGLELYERMEATDPEVCKSVNVLKMAVASDGMTVGSAIPLQSDPEFEEALQYQQFWRRCFANLTHPITMIIEEALDAIIYGHQIVQNKWEYQEEGKDKGLFLLKSLKAMPIGSVGIVVDPYMELLGYIETWPNIPVDSEEIAKKIIHPEKFSTLTLRMRHENMLGRSFLQAARIAYKVKGNIWPNLVRYLLQCAIPGIVIVAPAPPAVPQYELEADGKTIKRDPVTNRPITKSRVRQMLEEGVKFQNSGVLVIEHGGDFKQAEVKGNGEIFKVTRDMLNEEIGGSIVFQILATGISRIQAKSAAETHMSVLDLVVAYLRTQVIEWMYGVMRPLHRRNFGPEKMHLMPVLSMGDTERRDFASEAKAVAALTIAKFLHPSQFPMLDLMLGIHPRDPKVWSAFIEKEAELKEMEAQGKSSGQPKKKGPKKKGTDTPSPNTDPARTALSDLIPEIESMTDPMALSGMRDLLSNILQLADHRASALSAAD